MCISIFSRDGGARFALVCNRFEDDLLIIIFFFSTWRKSGWVAASLFLFCDVVKSAAIVFDAEASH